jgi:hypothetical protein
MRYRRTAYSIIRCVESNLMEQMNLVFSPLWADQSRRGIVWTKYNTIHRFNLNLNKLLRVTRAVLDMSVGNTNGLCTSTNVARPIKRLIEQKWFNRNVKVLRLPSWRRWLKNNLKETSFVAKFQMTAWYLIFFSFCGIVVRVPGYRFRSPGSILGDTRYSEK